MLWRDGIGAFVDLLTGEDAGIYIAATKGYASLSLSIFNGGDVEAGFDVTTLSELLLGIQTAARLAGFLVTADNGARMTLIEPNTVVTEIVFSELDEGDHGLITIAGLPGLVSLRLKLEEAGRDLTIGMREEQVTRLLAALHHAAMIAGGAEVNLTN